MKLDELLNPPIEQPKKLIKFNPSLEFTNYSITGLKDVFGYSFVSDEFKYIVIANRGENPNMHSVAYTISDNPNIVYSHNKVINDNADKFIKKFIIKNKQILLKFSNQYFDAFVDELV